MVPVAISIHPPNSSFTRFIQCMLLTRFKRHSASSLSSSVFPSSQNLFGPKIARSQKQSLNPRLGLRPTNKSFASSPIIAIVFIINFCPPFFFFHQDSPRFQRAPTHLMYCTTPNALFDDRQSLFVLPKKPASTQPRTRETKNSQPRLHAWFRNHSFDITISASTGPSHDSCAMLSLSPFLSSSLLKDHSSIDFKETVFLFFLSNDVSYVC